jgi:hypothetical protein
MLQPTTSANFIFRTALEIQVALEARLLGPGINAVIGAVILLEVTFWIHVASCRFGAHKFGRPRPRRFRATTIASWRRARRAAR